jgi:hypothetical protein
LDEPEGSALNSLVLGNTIIKRPCREGAHRIIEGIYRFHLSLLRWLELNFTMYVCLCMYVCVSLFFIYTDEDKCAM